MLFPSLLVHVVRTSATERATIAAAFFRVPPTCLGLAAYGRAFVQADPVFAMHVAQTTQDLSEAMAMSQACYSKWAWDMMVFHGPDIALCAPFLYFRDARPGEDCDAVEIYHFFHFATTELGLHSPAVPVSSIEWGNYRAWHAAWVRQARFEGTRSRVAMCITGAVRFLDKPRVYEGLKRHVVESANASAFDIFFVLNVHPEPQIPAWHHEGPHDGASRGLPSKAEQAAALRWFWSPGPNGRSPSRKEQLAMFQDQREPRSTPPGSGWPAALQAVLATLSPTAVLVEPAQVAAELAYNSSCYRFGACNRQFAGLEACYALLREQEKLVGEPYDVVYRARTDLLFAHDVGDARLFVDGVYADAPEYSRGLHDEFAVVTRAHTDVYFSAGHRSCLPQEAFDSGVCNTDGCQCRLRLHLEAHGVPIRPLRRLYLRPISWD